MRDDSPCACAVHSASSGRKALGVDPTFKAANLRRLRRIEGQVRRLQKMIAEDCCGRPQASDVRRQRTALSGQLPAEA